MAGPKFWRLLDFFPIETGAYQAESANTLGEQLIRYSGITLGAGAVYSYLLAQYGIRGLFDLRRPWRLILLMLAVYGSMLGGFRSALIIVVLTFALVFWLEGLCRTAYMAGIIALLMVGAAIVLPYARSLPMSVQRTLSVLPIDVDPFVIQNAKASSEWRVRSLGNRMAGCAQIPGQGQGLRHRSRRPVPDAGSRRTGIGQQRGLRGYRRGLSSGPLSILIPFGLFGAAGFLWFAVAALKVLRNNYRFGTPNYAGLIPSCWPPSSPSSCFSSRCSGRCSRTCSFSRESWD